MLGGEACARKPRHRLLVERPQRIGGGGLVVAGGEHVLLVIFRNQQQRAVDRHHLVEEHRDVHGARVRHAVVALPGAVVLMPLPEVALEGGLGVELELVDVNLFAEQLPQRLDQARMPRQQAEHFTEGVGGEGGAPVFSRQTSLRSSLRMFSASTRSSAISSSEKQLGKKT